MVNILYFFCPAVNKQGGKQRRIRRPPNHTITGAGVYEAKLARVQPVAQNAGQFPAVHKVPCNRVPNVDVYKRQKLYIFIINYKKIFVK